MGFKDWLIQMESWPSGGVPATNGGVEDFPGQNLNTSLPVRSKYSTQDGSAKTTPDAADGRVKPDTTFGFRSPEDKNAAQERRSQWIDKNRRRARFVTVPSDTIY
jgi:hypothetical protein